MSRLVKLLVVEDSEDDAKLSMLALRRGGFEPTYRRVLDAEALEAALDEEPWDAVLADFRLPSFSGIDALKLFRATGRDIPFIFVSGTIGEQTAVQAMKAGASDYVMKGDLARLAPALERELTQAAVRAERRKVQLERDQTVDLLQSISDNTAAVIHVKDLQGRYRMVNRRYSELFHVEGEQVIGRSDSELFPEQTARALRSVDQRVIEAEAPVIEEEVVPQDDGLHTYISVKSPLRDREGRVQGVFGISTDITERKRAESRTLAQLARLHLLDQITRAIGDRQDLQSIYQAVVRALEEQLPADFCCVCRHEAPKQMLTVACVGGHRVALVDVLSATEPAGIPIEENGLSRCVRGELVYEPDLSRLDSAFARHLAGAGLRALVAAPLQSDSRVPGVLFVARRKADSFSSGDCEFLSQLSAHVALAARQAELYGSLQLAYDDLRRSQQTALQQERLRALGQMASGIAHDINNAMSPASLYTQSLLEREVQLSASGRAQLESVARAIDDVAATVARLREFHRPRDAQATGKPVALNPLVGQVLDLTRVRWSDMPQQRGTVITVRTELDDALPPVPGVEGEIRDALINLVFNAVDAMPVGGTLTLRTRRVGEPAAPQLEVTDTGVGMDDDTRRRCLEPFFTTKGERGSGLGLAMVYGVAQRHGAELDIVSRPGRGTTVVLRFPAPMATAPTVAAKIETDAMPPRLRILVVDDDPLLLRSLRDILEADGHGVIAADAGLSGIDAFKDALARGDPFDVVITDLGMPHVNGRRVAAAVKLASPSTPVVLLTGWGQRLIDEGDALPHVDEMLPKPPKLRDLRRVLLRVAQSMDPTGTVPAPPGSGVSR